ncbi:MAG: Acetylornithine aminotransferase [Parcubacteria group bacterium GW2011_GWA2_31_28]|nr:MAG: Acetylornithine aminotransferase [Parcubacteria group bacterium GW2011_GWA2_31_28]
MSKLFVNTYKKRPLVIARAEGSFVFDKNDKKYLDFISGISVNNLGYSNPAILESISAQLQKVIHPSNYYYTQPQIDLAQKLINHSSLDKVFFANSGTEANEAAIIFLSKYQKLVPERNEIIVFEGTFLGRTYGSRIASKGGEIDNLKFIKSIFNDISDFKKIVSDKTLAVHIELVLGHGGIKKINDSFVKEIYQICQSKNLLIFIDEVQTGLGRTGNIFLFKEFGVKPDLVTLGKSLGGGIPLSAVLVSNRVAECVNIGDYGCTMGGNSLACVAGIKIIDYLSQKETIESIKAKSNYLYNKLDLLSKKHNSKIGELRYCGLMYGLQMDENIISDVIMAAFNKGLLTDVINKNTLRLLPPLTVTYDEIDTAVSILNEVLN